MKGTLRLISLAVLLLTAALLSSAGLVENWNYNSYYSSMNWKAFSLSRQGKQPINFNNINSELVCAGIFYATNQIRQNFNLPLFKYSRALQKAAFVHSQDMVTRGFMGHYSPVPGRRSPSDRVRLYGQWEHTVGENVADTFGIQYQTGTSFQPPAQPGDPIRDMEGNVIPNHTYWSFGTSVVSQWMNSPGHRRNILNPKFLVLGAGGAHYFKGNFKMAMIKATQVFAGKMNDEIATPR